MAGFLDFLKTPEGQGLIGAALGAAANAGRGGTLNTIGRAGLMGLGAMSQAQERELELADRKKAAEWRDLQMTQARDSMSREAAIRDAAKNAYSPSLPGMGGLNGSLPPEMQVPVVPGKAGGFDTKGFLNNVMSIDPIKGMEWQSKFKPKFNATPQLMRDPKSGALVNVLIGEDGSTQVLPFGAKPDIQLQDTGGRIEAIDKNAVGHGFSVPKTGNPFSDLVLSDGQGGVRPNAPLVGVKQGIARAGAPSISVNTDKSYFGNVAEGLAKIDVAAIDAGRSAPERIASARRVKEVLATSPITGTGAEARLALNKALSTAGLIDGNNVANTEVLASTLANQTLDAIKTSGLGSGQGFTDKDRAFLERAKSGNIEMTSQALATLADLNERAALASINRANSVITKLRGNQKSGDVGQGLDIIEPPSPQSVVRKSPTSALPAGKPRFLGFE